MLSSGLGRILSACQIAVFSSLVDNLFHNLPSAHVLGGRARGFPLAQAFLALHLPVSRLTSQQAIACMKQLSRAPRALSLITQGAVEPQHLQLSLAPLSSSLCWCPALFLHPNTLPLQGGTQPMAQPLLQAMHSSIFPPACAGRAGGGGCQYFDHSRQGAWDTYDSISSVLRVINLGFSRFFLSTC